MYIVKTKIKNGPKLIKTSIYKDNRGFLKETYKNKLFNINNFPFDIMSYSKKNVLRGLHIQLNKTQAKIITVTHGKIFDVAVDLRPNSKSFGKHVTQIISYDDNFSFYIPKGFAHGFMCISNTCTVNYKCSNYRDVKSEKTLSWNDKKINIKWPSFKPILSKKDKNGYSLDYFKNLKKKK